MSTQAPEQQALMEVERALPAELMSRFNAFLMKAHETSESSVDQLATATGFVVDSEAAFHVADTVQTEMKAAVKQLNDERLQITRPIDDFKQQFLDAAKPAIDNFTAAAKCYTDQMSAYRRQQREKAEAARLESERLLRLERERQEAAARKLEEKAATLKTAAAQEKAKQEAAEIRQVAAMMPETVALSAPEPQTVASNVATIWKAEVLNPVEFIQWLITRPEWMTCIQFKDAEMNRLARQMRDAIPVPGVKFTPEESYRSKAGRR